MDKPPLRLFGKCFHSNFLTFNWEGPTAGGSAAWPLPQFDHHFNSKLEIAVRRSLFEPWPSQLKPRVGQNDLLHNL
jgi:hypothetical protein